MIGLPPSLLATALVAAWVGLAFVPALLEAMRRRHATPLPVADSYQEDRRLGPFALAARVRDPEELGRALANVRRSGRSAFVPLDGDAHALVLAPETPVPRDASSQAIVLTEAWTSGVEAREVFESPIVVLGEVHLPPGVRVDGLYAESLLALGPEAAVDSWLYVEGDAVVGRGARLHGTATATETLTLGADTHFERVSGWLVQAGRTTERIRPQPRRSQASTPFEAPAHARVGHGRLFAAGDLDVPDGVVVDADIVATGTVRIGAGSVVRGAVKSRRDVHIGEGVFVQGGVFAERDVHVEAGTHVGGAVGAERHLTLAAEVEVGTPARPTTASGATVALALGASVYGTVWALEDGAVAAA